MVNGTGLTSGSIARSGACGGGSFVGAETMSWWRLGGFRKVTEGSFGKKVLG